MASSEELGPIAKMVKRTTPFKDNAGVKDASGKGINLTLYHGKLFSPYGEVLLNHVKSVKIRPDDVIISGYPKTGCHWMWETLGMIIRGKGEYSPYSKQVAYLEMAAPELFDNLASPRVLNTHHEYDWLPDEAKAKKTKIVVTARNPKDVAVSMYNHHIHLPEIYNYSGNFADWFQLFLNGQVDNGDYFDYQVSWDKSIKEHPDHPILVVKYEEMKKDLPGTIRKLAKFVNVTLTEAQVKEISKFAEFGNMRYKFEGLEMQQLIRKGEVGDWKNWLTDEQAKLLDHRSRTYLTGTLFEPIDTL